MLTVGFYNNKPVVIRDEDLPKDKLLRLSLILDFFFSYGYKPQVDGYTGMYYLDGLEIQKMLTDYEVINPDLI